MMTILYILIYFVIGFVVAKISKEYEETYTPGIKHSTSFYAISGMLWLPLISVWVLVFTLAFIYEIYKSKL